MLEMDHFVDDAVTFKWTILSTVAENNNYIIPSDKERNIVWTRQRESDREIQAQ